MDENAIKHLLRADRTLRRLIEKVGPCTLASTKERMVQSSAPFAALVKAVAHQQLTAKAASSILKRVLGLFPGREFPTPEDLLGVSEADLRGAGLSRAKIISVREIAAKTLEGVVPQSEAIAAMEDAEIIERLTTIRGVGPWTAEMLLIFELGRPDVLPVTDYGVRKGFALTYRWKDLPTPAQLLRHGEKWRPYRTTASWYLWRSLELPKGKRIERSASRTN